MHPLDQPMTHTTHSRHEIRHPVLSWPRSSIAGWLALGVLVGALVGYTVVRWHGLSLGLKSPGVVLQGTPGSVRTYGSLPELFAGKTGPQVSLSTLPSGPGVVAVGSLTELRGEITIVRGVTWRAYPASGRGIRTSIEPASGESAAFLVLADVPRWQEQKLSAPVPFERLATELEERARRAGIDTTKPFPVTIDGTFSEVHFNVVNGAALGSDRPTEARVRDTAVKGWAPVGEGTIVGFFAAKQGGRFVHAGERLHLHIVLPQLERAGHLDSAQIEPESVVHFPAVD
jgi:alpha-acetolactate decarboxylase